MVAHLLVDTFHNLADVSIISREQIPLPQKLLPQKLLLTKMAMEKPKHEIKRIRGKVKARARRVMETKMGRSKFRVFLS